MIPDGFGRSLLDDDGDMPVAILSRPAGACGCGPGPGGFRRCSFRRRAPRDYGVDPAAPQSPGLVWGTLRLPPLPVRLEPSTFDPEWGDDGAIGYPLLLRFHAILDLPHRWVYLKPLLRPPLRPERTVLLQ